MAGIGFWMVGVALCAALVPVYVPMPAPAVVAVLLAAATLTFFGAALLMVVRADRRKGKRS